MINKNGIKLSVCLPSLLTRIESLSELLKKLSPQLTNEVEVVILTDNKKISLWSKRNELVKLSHWEYIIMLDDDDDISDDYISSLLEAIEYWTDVICYKCKCSVNWQPYKLVNFWKDLIDWHTQREYFRKPNHLMCYRRDIILQVKWQDITYWEDFAFAQDINPLIKTEYQIDKVIYYYNYNKDKSECPNN